MNIDAALAQVVQPARYTGNEWNSARRDWDQAAVRLLLAYPDVYEVGMSNLGLQILYSIANSLPNCLAERAFAPWMDMEAGMRDSGTPLYGLESGHPARCFDIIGFSLQFELNYTNVLNMLDLAELPLLSADRDGSWPLVIAGGSCALNPEPLARFIDLFVLGDGEEVLAELLQVYHRGEERNDFLKRAAQIDGVYVPRFYEVEYQQDGKIASVNRSCPEAPACPRRRLVAKLPAPPVSPVVPYVEAVHDRAILEVMRGCTRGCRFCQAGVIYRPVRERPAEEALQFASELLANTGYDELGLISLSSTDYSHIQTLVERLKAAHPRLRVSLPSLRADSFSLELADATGGRRSSLTFAPEAGTERLRQVINKGITEDDVLSTAELAFRRGWKMLKLYFMIGLPTETEEDIEGIVRLVRQVQSIARRNGRGQVSATISTFIPKPHTPFQWVGQEPDVSAKQELLKRNLRSHKLGWGDMFASGLEAALARGDRRMGAAIERAWQLGARFDAWSEYQRPAEWEQAFSDCGVDPAFYANRQRDYDEILPWDHIDSGVTKRYLWREYRRALAVEATPDCRTGDCSGCGLAAFDPVCAGRGAS